MAVGEAINDEYPLSITIISEGSFAWLGSHCVIDINTKKKLLNKKERMTDDPDRWVTRLAHYMRKREQPLHRFKGNLSLSFMDRLSFNE